MTEIILTEKFSVASDFAKALGIPKKGDGCFRNEKTIITWAVGHLVELFEPEDYDETLKKWRIETLPVIPEKFRYKPIKKTYQQFKIIKSLLKEKNIERVIIATDAGREGEVIARTILLESGFTDKERIFRFWTSQALVPDVVRKTMNELKPISHYDRLWRAGYYRQVADWLVGMNCTRMVTLRLHGDLFSVGRVQTAVLALLVDRKNERDHFVPETYWIIKVLFSNHKGKWTGHWFRAGGGKNEREAGDVNTDTRETGRKVTEDNSRSIHMLKRKEEVISLHQTLSQAASGFVQSVKKEKKKEPPPFLFSLTDLQQEANRRFGFSAQKTLSIAQSLYQDKKCLSYPRTDSRVLGTQSLEMVKNIISKLDGEYPEVFKGIQPARISLANKRVFNDAKLTDHHALIPFKPISASATRDEQLLFNLVMTRFAAVFYPDCAFENTNVITILANETFQTSGRVVLFSGWRAVYQEQEQQKSSGSGENFRKESDNQISSDSKTRSFVPGNAEIVEHIPPLVQGDSALPEKITPEEKQTTPPPDYNDSLILKDMTNPGRYVDEEEIKKLYRGDIGIGTQATRAQIIETLISRKYIERSGKKLIATEKGLFLVEMLRKCPITSVLTSPEETARWEMSLNQIALGESSGMPFRQVQSTNSIEMRGIVSGQIQNLVSGQIQNLVSGQIQNSVSGQIQNSVSGQIQNSVLRTTTERSFLDRIKTFVTSAVNELKLARLEVKNFNLDVPASAVIGKCPACGKHVRENRKGFSCEDRACKFIIWKKIAGKIISPAIASNLLTFKKSGPFKGFISREKKKFSAILVLNQQDREWKVSFDFNNNVINDKDINSKTINDKDINNKGINDKDINNKAINDKDINNKGINSKDLENKTIKNNALSSVLPVALSDVFFPLCRGNIIEGKKGYGCANWRPEHGGCRFVIWKEIMGKKLTEKNIQTLATGKTTSLYVFKDQQGNKFKAKLKMFTFPLNNTDCSLSTTDTTYATDPTDVIHSANLNHSADRTDKENIDIYGKKDIYSKKVRVNKTCTIEVMPESNDVLPLNQRHILCSR
ncbi:MAG: topoisomerase C-terminal repeat-containing protein [Desulfamplus sp.]|nr:topoisomerase C-terminal repeat-containing protein [Desulfamplus sp.]